MDLILNQFSNTSTQSYQLWYASLTKPFFAPEPWVFGVAWGLIYPLIALALLWSIYLYSKKRVSLGFLGVFLVNLVLNLTFTPVVFLTHSNVLISLHIILVLLSLIWMQWYAWRNTKVIFVLLLPYLLWGSFATVLQLTLTALN